MYADALKIKPELLLIISKFCYMSGGASSTYIGASVTFTVASGTYWGSN
jgi:hypothetical protein